MFLPRREPWGLPGDPPSLPGSDSFQMDGCNGAPCTWGPSTVHVNVQGVGYIWDSGI